MNTWWGEIKLDNDGLVRRQIGPLRLAIRRDRFEWQIHYERVKDWLDRNDEDARSDPDASVPGPQNLKERYVLNGDVNPVSLLPALADRSVVARPVTPLYVPVRQTTTIYVSTPLCVRIVFGREKHVLTEIPIQRPPDTWFGPDTREGELCYASRTSARMTVNELPRRSYRATTPIQIRNESSSHLLLERINLPVPFLELYQGADNRLWTQAVKMVRKADAKTATLEILDGPPSQVSTAEKLTAAREKTEEKTIIRKIGDFFA